MTKAKPPKKKKKAPAKTARRGKAAALPAVPKTPVSEISPDEQIVGAVFLGKVRNYLPESAAMTLVLEAPLAVGESIRVKGHTTDLTQRVEHLELNRQSVPGGAPGDEVGVSVADRVRVGDAVYKL